MKAETPKVERKCKKKLDYSHSQGELDAKKLKKPAEATPERAFLLREVDPTNILHMRLRSSPHSRRQLSDGSRDVTPKSRNVTPRRASSGKKQRTPNAKARTTPRSKRRLDLKVHTDVIAEEECKQSLAASFKSPVTSLTDPVFAAEARSPRMQPFVRLLRQESTVSLKHLP